MRECEGPVGYINPTLQVLEEIINERQTRVSISSHCIAKSSVKDKKKKEEKKQDDNIKFIQMN